MKYERIIIVGGFGDEEMIPTLVEGFLDAGLEVDHIPSRGVIESMRQRDLQFADKEIIAFPILPDKMPFNDERDFCQEVRDIVHNGPLTFVLWWYAKDDRPPGLIESLGCPTVRFSWDDPMALEGYREDWSRGFTHAVTSCRDSISHYTDRGIRAMHTLPPVSPTRHGQATATPGEECDICFSFYTLYDGQAPYLRERVKRRDLIEAAAGLGRVHVYGGWGRNEFKRLPRAAYRGFRTTAELPGIYAASKIVVSQHPQIDAAGYVSPRDMEAMACGALLLSDECAGMKDLNSTISPVSHQFLSLSHFIYIAEMYLGRAELRKESAEFSRKYILREYSGKRFAERLLGFVEKGDSHDELG